MHSEAVARGLGSLNGPLNFCPVQGSIKGSGLGLLIWISIRIRIRVRFGSSFDFRCATFSTRVCTDDE